jgi:hypothetical protein
MILSILSNGISCIAKTVVELVAANSLKPASLAGFYFIILGVLVITKIIFAYSYKNLK